MEEHKESIDLWPSEQRTASRLGPELNLRDIQELYGSEGESSEEEVKGCTVDDIRKAGDYVWNDLDWDDENYGIDAIECEFKLANIDTN